MSDAFMEYETIGKIGHDKDVVSDLSVKLYDGIIVNREEILKAFIAETGLRPSECEQVFSQDRLTWYVRKKREE
ncbi:MAG: hypothetical protein GY718_20465 [Lentisphaerae bacterium]|nr:hypothetical protein [Lentisphaerota bacterium]